MKAPMRFEVCDRGNFREYLLGVCILTAVTAVGVSRMRGVVNCMMDAAQSLKIHVQNLYSSTPIVSTSASGVAFTSIHRTKVTGKVEEKRVPFVVPESNFFIPRFGLQWTNFERAEIYKDSIQAMENGYRLNGRTIELNRDDENAMMTGARFYESVGVLPPIANPVKTVFSVDTDDTFNVLLKLKSEGKNPVGINMAHSVVRGGGVIKGCPAQEECEYRRSNYRKTDSIATIQRAVLKEGVIYTPSISVFRKDESEGYAFMESPETVSIVAVAGLDFRDGSLDRLELGLPLHGSISEVLLRKNAAYITGTKNRIRNMLRAMALHGHKEIVLGALGCGAFENPPKLVANLFREVFSETEFKGRFTSVHFAILLKSYDKDSANVDVFQKLCKIMNDGLGSSFR